MTETKEIHPREKVNNSYSLSIRNKKLFETNVFATSTVARTK